MKRDLSQIQHIQDIRIAHFIADGKGDHIEILHRTLAFQRPEWQIMLAHGLLHVSPGGKDTLAPNAIHLVHHAIENPHTHIGHTDLVGIRETKGNIDPNIFRIFLNFIEFSAGVTGRLLHRGENSPQ